jgi:DNA-binding FadR family transcriptional regulator
MPHYAPRSSLVDTAANIMREQIAAGHWKVGERIPTEPKLAGMLQVSRGTVREAVKILAFSGLLEVRQGAGTYLRAVCDSDDTLKRLKRASLRDHFEVRCSLEVEAARLAARRRTDEDVVRLHRLLEDCGRRSDHYDNAAFVERDLAFHQALVAVARNPALEELYRWFSAAVSDTIAATFETDLPEPDQSAHRAIVDAIAAGDPDSAEIAVRRFMAPVLAELEMLLAP